MTNTNNEVIFEIKNLQTYFPIYEGFIKKKKVADVKAVDNVSFTVKRGETLGIVGESGCGKTTLGKSIMMLQKPTGGEARFNMNGEMKDIRKFSKEELFKFKKQVQMVFQDPYSSLNPMKTIYDAFDEPLKAHGYISKEEREQIMIDRLKTVNLQAEYIYRYPHEFSGGQRQRICIARALCVEPQVVVLDEPVSALDVSIQAQVLNLMQDIQKQFNLTYIFIAHDLSVVEYISDRIIVMYLGNIVEISKAEGLYKNPLHPYTQALLSAIPIPVVGADKNRIVLEGDVPSPINKPSGCAFHTRCKKAMDICKTQTPVIKNIDSEHMVACHLY
ncbi:oligopeptide/dipeptide ABC transporter, ATP-binding protein domain [Peptoanaerobacter stomatis]|uniref:Oligopeptide/dipeptide ABC transporter, ATP-binding protein domain n=1 Tax=Peptoanaerobacter stomatis TaxID=796937 RepID=V9HUX2_9FIRM|nr:dipeptide ABC transporter ATP-binding protein [Peptoanaerobacter stomatis]EHL18015.1 oligopeptide/dipeptide ABC transporter, ATP-binding protein domain [Peptoanaerobacter stomatis]